MIDYIKLFNNIQEANNYKIENLPFLCYVDDTEQDIACTESDVKLVAKHDSLILVKTMPNNKIWYTGTSQVTPYNTNVFGANYVSKRSIFTGATHTGKLVFDDDVKHIGGRAFYGCSSLTSVTIPNSVISIGEQAFYNCSSLTSVTIPNSVTSIGRSAFCSCNSLTSVTIPNSVTSIREGAFKGCGSLTSLSIEVGNTIYDSRDNCNAIIETASNTLIAGCKNTIIPNSVTSIRNYAFHGCCSLTSVTIPNSVTSIGGNAFRDCSGLTSVTIGNSVTSIGPWAFKNCSNLTSVYMMNPTPPSIGSSVFNNTNCTIYVKNVDDYKAATGWSEYSDRIKSMFEEPGDIIM